MGGHAGSSATRAVLQRSEWPPGVLLRALKQGAAHSSPWSPRRLVDAHPQHPFRLEGESVLDNGSELRESKQCAAFCATSGMRPANCFRRAMDGRREHAPPKHRANLPTISHTPRRGVSERTHTVCASHLSLQSIAAWQRAHAHFQAGEQDLVHVHSSGSSQRVRRGQSPLGQHLQPQRRR